MSKLHEKISIENFSIENIDISSIEAVVNLLPSNGIIDANIAERGLMFTLEGQNLCQERIVQIDRWIGFLDSEKNKAWSQAALFKAKEAGFKTVKDKEWHAQADSDYIDASNNLVLAKACKKWLENKASYFSGWHYALKTFLSRDYNIENASSIGYNNTSVSPEAFPAASIDTGNETSDNDLGGDTDEFEWG